MKQQKIYYSYTKKGCLHCSLIIHNLVFYMVSLKFVLHLHKSSRENGHSCEDVNICLQRECKYTPNA